MNAAFRRTLFAAVPVVLLLGCSSKQLYGSAQQWQRTECRKLPAGEQERCLKSAAMSFEEYQRQAASARP
jgi:hypothetical protein